MSIQSDGGSSTFVELHASVTSPSSAWEVLSIFRYVSDKESWKLSFVITVPSTCSLSTCFTECKIHVPHESVLNKLKAAKMSFWLDAKRQAREIYFMHKTFSGMSRALVSNELQQYPLKTDKFFHDLCFRQFNKEVSGLVQFLYP